MLSWLFTHWFSQQMHILALPSILLVLPNIHAFQYDELVQYIDSHQEEYVEVICFFFTFYNPCCANAQGIEGIHKTKYAAKPSSCNFKKVLYGIIDIFIHYVYLHSNIHILIWINLFFYIFSCKYINMFTLTVRQESFGLGPSK